MHINDLNSGKAKLSYMNTGDASQGIVKKYLSLEVLILLILEEITLVVMIVKSHRYNPWCYWYC